MIGFKHTQHITLTVSNIERSLAFYTGLLKFPIHSRLEVADNPDGLVIHFLDIGNGVLLELLSFNTPPQPTEWLPDDLQAGYRHLAFWVADTDAVYADLKAKGVEFTLEPLSTDGVRLAFFKDPDGNLLEILSGQLEYKEVFNPRLAATPQARVSPAGCELAFCHLALTVLNRQKAVTFYRDQLGFEAVGTLGVDEPGKMHITFLQAGNAALEVFSFGPAVYPRQHIQGKPTLGIRHIAYEVRDVPQTTNDLEQRQVKVARPPRFFAGIFNSFFEDPDGNSFEVISGRPMA
jgi:catechol 2,3-dioxygenase-like lactoylglutathione lyase family enzyme